MGAQATREGGGGECNKLNNSHEDSLSHGEEVSEKSKMIPEGSENRAEFV